MYVTGKPGEQYCNSYIQQREERGEEDYKVRPQKKVHAWAAIGYDFKLPLIFFEITCNNNGKMAQKDYNLQILQPAVLPWIQAGYDFALEEDGSSGHSLGPKNI